MKKFHFFVIALASLQIAWVAPETDVGTMYKSGPAYWTNRYPPEMSDYYLSARDDVGMLAVTGFHFVRPQEAVEGIYLAGLKFADGRPSCSADTIASFRIELTFGASEDTLWPLHDMHLPYLWRSEIFRVPRDGQTTIDFFASYGRGWNVGFLDELNNGIIPNTAAVIRIVHENGSGVFVSTMEAWAPIRYSLDEANDPNFLDIGIGGLAPAEIVLLNDGEEDSFSGIVCRGAYNKDPYSSPRVGVHLTQFDGQVAVEKYILLPESPSQTHGEFALGLTSVLTDWFPEATLHIVEAGYIPAVTCSGDSSFTILRNIP